MKLVSASSSVVPGMSTYNRNGIRKTRAGRLHVNGRSAMPVVARPSTTITATVYGSPSIAPASPDASTTRIAVLQGAQGRSLERGSDGAHRACEKVALEAPSGEGMVIRIGNGAAKVGKHSREYRDSATGQFSTTRIIARSGRRAFHHLTAQRLEPLHPLRPPEPGRERPPPDRLPARLPEPPFRRRDKPRRALPLDRATPGTAPAPAAGAPPPAFPEADTRRT